MCGDGRAGPVKNTPYADEQTMTEKIDAIAGAKETLARIRDDGTRKALQELLETAIELQLNPRLEPLGNQTGFSFGLRRYPLCRVNATKGIAFHGTVRADAMIIRSTEDRTFRLATGTLRRTALSAALDR